MLHDAGRDEVNPFPSLPQGGWGLPLTITDKLLGGWSQPQTLLWAQRAGLQGRWRPIPECLVGAAPDQALPAAADAARPALVLPAPETAVAHRRGTPVPAPGQPVMIRAALCWLSMRVSHSH